MNEEIYVTKPVLPPIEEYMEYLNDIWNTRNLTNFGKYARQLMIELMEFMNTRHCLSMVNGHMALEMTLQAMNLSGEVITTPFTFASTTHAIVRNGLTPVFCDIRESDCTMDPDKIEALITDKTTAIVPVHVYGQPCDIEKIEAIAKKHNLKVIYDAAHAFGEEYKGKSIGKYGDACMFSFHATKAFNSIEGGLAVVHDSKTLTRIYQLHNFGIMDEETVEFVGANAKMNEFQAAMGLCNLKHFEENRRKRKAIFDYYREQLADIEGIRMLSYDEENVKYNYSYFPIFVEAEKYGMDRNQLSDLLLKNHIHTRKYFYPLTCDYDCYKNQDFRGAVSVGKRIANQVLTIPLYADLQMEVAQLICDVIRRKA